MSFYSMAVALKIVLFTLSLVLPAFLLRSVDAQVISSILLRDE